MDLVRVEMKTGSITRTALPEDKLIGGRGLVDWFMTEYVSPTAHPLSAENPFIIAVGLLAGTNAPSSGRLSVGGKSPLTGGIKEANVGGIAGHKLGRLGIQGIVVEGRAHDWQVLRVGAHGLALDAADDIIGLDNYDACDLLRRRYGEKAGILIIGPAGERLYANSTVAATDPEGRPCRHAARGGVGAIMGAKRLKAVVVDDTGHPLRKARDPEAFRRAVRAVMEMLQAFPPRQMLHTYGTFFFVDGDNGRGSLPTLNHREGAFAGAVNMNAARLTEINKVRHGSTGHGCMPGCAVRCSNIFNDAEGRFVTAGLEYETLAMLGPNLGIDDLDAIARMDRRCDGLGMDTIEAGCAIGILEEAGLFEFGNIPMAEALFEEIAKGSPLGRILGSGTEVTARVYGIDRVPTVKGQAIPAHSARSLKGWGVTYATSPQGADHTAGSVLDEPLSPVGQVERSRNSQIATTALDAAGFCFFTFLQKSPDLVAPMINAFYGVNWSTSDYLDLGREMLRQERAFNAKAGMGAGTDRLPDWMRKEPLAPTNAVFDVPQQEMDEMFNF